MPNATPVLNPGASPAFTTILENAVNPAGISVATLVVDGSITDLDLTVAVEAILIEILDTSLGVWQYSLDGGSNWLTIRADLVNSTTGNIGLVLGSAALLRLVPFGELSGTRSAALTFRAWDQTEGVSGDYITYAPGLNSVSADSDAASLTVTAVNDAPSFASPAGTGKVIFSTGTQDDSAAAVLVLPDGSLIVAGTSNFGADDLYSAARLGANGILDTSFGTAGRFSFSTTGTTGMPIEAALQADGKIVLAGGSFFGDFIVARMNANGSADTGFDGDGHVLIDIPSGFAEATSVAIQADGKIIVAGVAGDGFMLIRLDGAGALDSGFGAGGISETYVGSFGGIAYDVAVQGDGKIIAVGDDGGFGEFAVIRLNDDGTLDSAFGSGGVASVPVTALPDAAQAVALQTNGKIVVAGYSSNGANDDFSVARLDTDGNLDTSFGTGGVTIIDIGGDDDQAYDVVVQPDGKLLVAGLTHVGGLHDFALVRLNANGTLDTSFAAGGTFILNLGSGEDEAMAVSLQPDGKILLAGEAESGGSDNFALVRLNTDGSLDTSFGAAAAASTLGGTVAHTEGGAAVVLDNNVSPYDYELSKVGNFGGATLTLARDGGANATDVFSATGSLAALTQGAGLVVGANTIGTVTTHSAGTLLLTFNTSATKTLVESAMRQIAYSTGSDAPGASAVVRWTLSDGNTGSQGTGGALTAFGTVTVNITAVNDAPVAAPVALGSSPEDAVFGITAATLLAGVTDVDTLAAGRSITGLTVASGGGLLTGNANGWTYTPATNFVGAVSFNYTASDGQFTSSSTASLTLVAANDAPTGSVTVTGTPTQGQTLSVSHTLADLDGLGPISYQWLANGVAIVGATGSTLLLTQDQVGKTVSARASYTDGGSNAEAVTSALTAAVANVNDAPAGGVTFSGTPTQGQTLSAANTLSDPDGLGTISYQWLAGGVAIGGATGSTLVLGQAQVGQAISVRAGYTDGGGTTEAVTSAAGAAVANVNDAPTGSVTVTGTATQGQTLTASNTLADLDGLGTIAWQWLANGIAIAGATANTLVPGQDQVGKTISVRASYTDGGGAAESKTSTATAAVSNANDAPGGAVGVAGTAAQGQTLTASNTLTDTDGLGAIGYQWLADGIAIAGATGGTLVLGQAQVGKAISVRASYTDGGGTAEAVTSAATAAVANVNDPPTGTVTVAGTPTQGRTLSASSTLADIDGLGAIAWQWLAGGVELAGATGASLLLGQAQVGQAISVRASYTDGGGTAESKTSSATATVANVNDAPSGAVAIVGTPVQGQTLAASSTLADADGLGSLAYQWLANGTAIAGATGSTLVLAQAQVGKTLTVRISYTDGGGTAESRTSTATAAVANVNDPPAGAVAIAGTATQGQTLSASHTLSDIDGLGSLSYQWLADGSAIAGATASTLALTQARVGQAISVRASYTDGGGTAEAVTSSPTAAVANVNDAPTGTVTISGTRTQGQTLSAANTLADIDGMGAVSYQWLAAGVEIAGATGSTLVLGQAQVGKAIAVRASYTDGGGAAESKTSAATSAVANVNDAPVGAVLVAGPAEEGATLLADTAGLADADGLGTLAYQWLRNGASIGGATGASLLLGLADIGAAISVRVRYTDAWGAQETLNSAATAAVAATDPAPEVLAFEPADEAPAVALDAAIVVTFSEAIARGAGSIVLRIAGGAVVESFDAAASARLEISGAVLTIRPTADLAHSTPYVLEFPAGSVRDLAGHGYAGSSGYGFTTVDPPRELTGTDDPDVLLGGTGDDSLFGGLSDDSISGSLGNDSLDGAQGDDLLDGGEGGDTMIGGEGDDTFIVDSAGDQVVETDGAALAPAVPEDALAAGIGGGIDKVVASISYTLGGFVENLNLAGGAAALAGTGNALDNVIEGNAAANALASLGGADTLGGAGGNDTLDGGTGSDEAGFSGNRSQYTLEAVSGGHLSADSVAGRDGQDLLQNIELLRYADRTVDLTAGARSQTVSAPDLKILQELYVGFFNRVPEAQGLGFWIDLRAGGESMESIANQFYSAGTLFGVYSNDMTDAQFVREIYKNVLGRPPGVAPTDSEVAFWVDKLVAGTATEGTMVLQMLSDVHTFFEGITDVSHPFYSFQFVSAHLNNKAAVAHYYAVEQGLSMNVQADNVSFGIALAQLITPTDMTAAIAFIGVDAFSTLEVA